MLIEGEGCERDAEFAAVLLCLFSCNYSLLDEFGVFAFFVVLEAFACACPGRVFLSYCVYRCFFRIFDIDSSAP